MFTFMGPKRFPYSNYMDVDLLPHVDAVLISHDHYDHLDYKTILNLKDQVDRFYVPLSVGAHLEEWGIPSEHIIELNWWESVNHENLTFIFTPSRHFSGRAITDRFSTLWGSWIIQGAASRVFFGGDSGYYQGFKEIGEKYGPFDLTFLECGAYNENWADIHMAPEETVQAHMDLKGKFLMPIHWGKFNLSLHPWKEPIERAIKKGNDLGVRILTPPVGSINELSDNLKTPRWWEEYN
jgi:L-ascorbate metabolism protein UlaG (beta-lactamase superfamily)